MPGSGAAEGEAKFGDTGTFEALTPIEGEESRASARLTPRDGLRPGHHPGQGQAPLSQPDDWVHDIAGSRYIIAKGAERLRDQAPLDCSAICPLEIRREEGRVLARVRKDQQLAPLPDLLTHLGIL